MFNEHHWSTLTSGQKDKNYMNRNKLQSSTKCICGIQKPLSTQSEKFLQSQEFQTDKANL